MLSMCPKKNTVVGGRAHRDYACRIYARAADTPDSPNPTITIRYFYPLQPDSIITPMRATVKRGDCIAWLDHRAAGTLGAPMQRRTVCPSP